MVRHLLLQTAALGLASAAAAATTTDPCETGPISVIFVDSRSIFDTSDPSLDSRFERAYDIANALHIPTRESVIRRELLFREGDCYDPVLLEESARLLRAFEFLSRVDIFGLRQDDGTYHVVVDTQDEWSTRLNMRVGLEEKRLTFGGARVRENNFLGRGQRLEAYYLDNGIDDEFGVAWETPQLGGTRWDFAVGAGRTSAGTTFHQVLAYPFGGEIGRWAVRQAVRQWDAYFEYVAGNGDDPEIMLLAMREEAGELALVRRFGSPGDLTLIGGALTYQRLTYPEFRLTGSSVALEAGAEASLVQAVDGQRDSRDNVRAVLLLGRRNLRWVARRGLDSMRGQQDVALGTETQLAIGRSLPHIRGDDDIFATLALRGGAESRSVLVAGRARAEIRRDFGRTSRGTQWEDLVADGEAQVYWRPVGAPAHTVVFRATAAGAWHTRTPFQLTLGGERAVRGYDPDQFPGGRRLTASLEERVYFGWPAPDVFDLGGTLFVDAGRVWPGDAPFGVDSGWRAALGAGLRTSFPAGSRSTYRLDVAVPVVNGLDWSSLRVTFTAGEVRGLRGLISGRAAVEPQLGRSRLTGLPGELFHFPD